MSMTPEQRRAARERCDRAAPPPWIVENLKEVVAPCPCCGRICVCDQFGVSDSPSCYHSEFIAHARTDLAAALDQIDADEALMREVMEGLEWAIAQCELGPVGSGAVVALRARLGPAPEPTP